MKKWYEALTILLVLVSSSSLILLRNMPSVRATYVEGIISQDTVWFLVDSPFVLSGDVTVNSGATLTIEPGVQVRFGGLFSLNVNGRIVADGTSDRRIHFTTNDPAGDITWQTLRINGTQPSSLINCQIDHGTDALTIDNGYTEVQNGAVTTNSQNGIVINNGTVHVTETILASNNMAGVQINGGSQVTIDNNTVASNQFGIVMSGSLVGDMSISQNIITNNTDSGIVLESDVYSNTMITRNVVLGNGNGFLVRNSTSPDIAYNYILNNMIGITYELGNNHQAHFNELSNNKLAMDASSNATVDATYNYWGDKSGPFHPSLNPNGKGNAVGGNGTDVDFIFFLSMPIDYVNQRPVAAIWTDKSLVALNQNVTFIGTDSHDEGRVDQYFFDFGDGTNTGWITSSLFNHTYSSAGTYSATLFVKDDFNAISESAPVTSITVQDLTPLAASLTLDAETVDFNGNVSLTAYVSDGNGPVQDATVMLFSVKGGAFSTTSGITDSTGYFETVFTAPNVTEVTDIRIIARASKNGYADGSDFRYLKVLPPLNVQVDSEPSTVSSEGNATVTVHVEDNFGRPVPGANVSLSADNGTLSQSTGTTDINGTTTFLFTAPLTFELVNVTLTATISKTEYAVATSQSTIAVQPKMLLLELTATPESTLSEGNSTITIRVTHDSEPISDATVTMSSNAGGNFSAEEATTDSNGTSEFLFTAPQTTSPGGINATLTAIVTKDGYVEDRAEITVPVKPKFLSAQIFLSTNTVYSEEIMTLTVNVKYDNSSIENATITLTSQPDEFTSGAITDTDGKAIVEFTAPHVNDSTNFTITVTAKKAGYVDSTCQASITVNPKVGFPVLMAILIILPIVIVAVVAVLIKLKVLVVSAKEET